MDPLTIAMMVGGPVLSTAGGVAGHLLSAEDREEAARLEKLAMQQAMGLDAGSPEAQQLGGTAYDGINVDPRLRAARMSALERLQSIGLEGGMDAESKAALAEATQQANQQEQGQRGAILQNAQSRGMLGSNATLGAQLQAQQSGADRVAMAGTQAAADARRRALAALAQSGEMAAGIERDEYGMQADKAGANDAISVFNARNSIDQRNRYQDNLYRNAMARQDAYGMGAAGRRQQAAQTQQMWAGTGQGAGQGSTGVADYLIKRQK